MASWTDFPWFDTPQERMRDEYARGRIDADKAYRIRVLTSDSIREHFREKEISRRMLHYTLPYEDCSVARERVIDSMKREQTEKRRKWARSHTQPYLDGYHDETAWLERNSPKKFDDDC